MSEDGFSDPYDEPSMELFIETLTGTTFEMRVYPSDTILDIKKKIQRVEGIPVHHQNLLFRLQEVEDYKRLCDIGVVSGSVLKLVLSMRGGPISTRRLSACDHHLIWKDLKELIEHTREELGDKLNAGAKVSVLVFKDGDIINLIRVIENDDGSYHPYGDKSSSSPTRLVLREDGQVGFYSKLQENNTMLAKLTELRKKMSDLSLKRNFKNSKPVESEEASSVGCIGEKPLKESEEDAAEANDPKSSLDAGVRYHLLDKFRKDAESLLKLHESQFRDEDEEDVDSDDFEDALQVCEDSIALKEKHRGKNSFYNILFQEPLFKPHRTGKPPKGKYFGDLPVSSTFSKEARERTNFHVKSNDSLLKTTSKLKDKSSEISGNSPSISRSISAKDHNNDEKLINSSILSRFNSNSYSNRTHKYDSKINLPDITCDLDISPPTTASSIAESIAIIDEDTENEDKEVLSPIGVPCAGTVSMSKVSARNSVRLTPLLLQNPSDRPKTSPETVNLEENAQEICDIFTGESSEGFRSNKLGLLKRWQSVDCSSEEVCNPSTSRKSIEFNENCERPDFDVIDRHCYLPPLFPTSPGAIPSQYAPKNDRVSDLYFGNRINQERISRSPLYRRYSQSGNFPVESSSSDNSLKNSDNNCSRKSHSLTSSWGSNVVESKSSGDETNSKCDNILNIQPFTGTLLNFLTGKSIRSPDSELIESRVELNPLRIRNEQESKKLANEIKNLCTREEEHSGSAVNKIQVNTTQLKNLPAIINKKRMRCGQCNKRLNITNMYDCRCGGIFCGQHRYSEVHMCNYDYKTEGRKLLEQQNPVIVADKLNKL